MSEITNLIQSKIEFDSIIHIGQDRKDINAYIHLKKYDKELLIKKLSSVELNNLNQSIPNIDYRNGRSWIAGGSIRDTLSSKGTYNDIDVFSLSFNDAIEFILKNNLLNTCEIIEDNIGSEYKIKSIKYIKENINLYKQNPGDFALQISSNPIYKLDFLRNDGKHIQVMINQNYNDPGECINSFDLTMCQFAYNGESLFYFKDAAYDLKNKIIRIHKLNDRGFFYPNFKRIMKFLDQGYKIDRISYNTMITHFEEVLKDPNKAMDNYFNAVQYLNDTETKMKSINLKNKFYFIELNSVLSEENFV